MDTKMSSGAQQKYNKLIREQCAGGSETLDALELFSKISRRHQQHTEAGQISRLAETHLGKIKKSMTQQVKIWKEENENTI